METEGGVGLPVSINSGSRIIDGDGKPCELDSKPDYDGGKEGAVDGESFGLQLGGGDIGTAVNTTGSEKPCQHQGDFRTEEGSKAPEDLGLIVGDKVTEEGAIDQDNLVPTEVDVETEDGQLLVETEVDMDLVNSPIRPMLVEVADTVTVVSFRVADDSGSKIESHAHNQMMERRGVKRARMTYDEPQPSVHVTYNSLTRSSKRKLEELLRNWSEWHAQNDTSSSRDENEVLESGEDTYFPALRVSGQKSSAVSFWIENQTRKQQNNDFIPIDHNSVPLYDRGYSLGLTSADTSSNMEGGLEIVDEAARCFNCGSYSHSLKECRKPLDKVAVNSARKQHKSKRNQSAGPLIPTRYYQNSSGGKYDGLKPGALDAATQQLLGLGELDPPPWLNRMRELGYPPGYLDLDQEDQPSGITIFSDEDVKGDQEDGEILETEQPEPRRKMSVEFPGINAPIPENADERLWAAGPSGVDPIRNQSHRRSNYSVDPIDRSHHREQRWYREFLDDGPPGVEPIFSPSSYPPRYGIYSSSYGFDSPRSPPWFARSQSDRGRIPLAYEDYAAHGSYANRHPSPRENGSSRSGSHRQDYSLWGNDEYDRYSHRSWR